MISEKMARKNTIFGSIRRVDWVTVHKRTVSVLGFYNFVTYFEVHVSCEFFCLKKPSVRDGLMVYRIGQFSNKSHLLPNIS